MKKAIVLDLDETLECGISQNKYIVGQGFTMVLRPKLDVLITKLQEAKKQHIDIILCTTAHEEWVERFFILKQEFKDVFDKIYTQDNEKEWNNYSQKDYPLEYKAKEKNINLEYAKPITTFGYDSVLFIDNSKIEELRLKILFEITQGQLQKDITFFSAFGFNGGNSNWKEILIYEEIAKQNKAFAQRLKEYLNLERNDPGCEMMCSAIENFLNKKFKKGLTLLDNKYSQKYQEFNKEIAMLKKELEENSGRFIEAGIENINGKLRKWLKKDKKYPYEGIEVL